MGVRRLPFLGTVERKRTAERKGEVEFSYFSSLSDSEAGESRGKRREVEPIRRRTNKRERVKRGGASHPSLLERDCRRKTANWKGEHRGGYFTYAYGGKRRVGGISYISQRCVNSPPTFGSRGRGNRHITFQRFSTKKKRRIKKERFEVDLWECIPLSVAEGEEMKRQANMSYRNPVKRKGKKEKFRKDLVRTGEGRAKERGGEQRQRGSKRLEG